MTEQHGIREAFYQNTPTGLATVMICLCGARFAGTSWEEVGLDLDLHLAIEGGEPAQVLSATR